MKNRIEKGKPIEKWGHKAANLKRKRYDGWAADVKI